MAEEKAILGRYILSEEDEEVSAVRSIVIPIASQEISVDVVGLSSLTYKQGYDNAYPQLLKSLVNDQQVQEIFKDQFPIQQLLAYLAIYIGTYVESKFGLTDLLKGTKHTLKSMLQTVLNINDPTGAVKKDLSTTNRVISKNPSQADEAYLIKKYIKQTPYDILNGLFNEFGLKWAYENILGVDVKIPKDIKIRTGVMTAGAVSADFGMTDQQIKALCAPTIEFPTFTRAPREEFFWAPHFTAPLVVYPEIFTAIIEKIVNGEPLIIADKFPPPGTANIETVTFGPPPETYVTTYEPHIDMGDNQNSPWSEHNIALVQSADYQTPAAFPDAGGYPHQKCGWLLNPLSRPIFFGVEEPYTELKTPTENMSEEELQLIDGQNYGNPQLNYIDKIVYHLRFVYGWSVTGYDVIKKLDEQINLLGEYGTYWFQHWYNGGPGPFNSRLGVSGPKYVPYYWDPPAVASWIERKNPTELTNANIAIGILRGVEPWRAETTGQQSYSEGGINVPGVYLTKLAVMMPTSWSEESIPGGFKGYEDFPHKSVKDWYNHYGPEVEFCQDGFCAIDGPPNFSGEASTPPLQIGGNIRLPLGLDAIPFAQLLLETALKALRPRPFLQNQTDIPTLAEANPDHNVDIEMYDASQKIHLWPTPGQPPAGQPTAAGGHQSEAHWGQNGGSAYTPLGHGSKYIKGFRRYIRDIRIWVLWNYGYDLDFQWTADYVLRCYYSLFYTGQSVPPPNDIGTKGYEPDENAGGQSLGKN